MFLEALGLYLGLIVTFSVSISRSVDINAGVKTYVSMALGQVAYVNDF